jgi:uncharacterized membrane protein YdjX (TVP38/TMEM64 family)
MIRWLINKIQNHYLYKAFLENRRLFFILALVAILPVTVASFTLIFFQSLHDAYDFSNTQTAIVFFVVTTITMAFALTPTTFIAVIAGHFFTWPGLAGVVISYVIASVLGLLAGRYIRKTFVGYALMQRQEVKHFFESLGHREFLLVMYGRLSPVLPFAMMNIAFAHMNLQWRYYLAGSLAGMFPRTFMFFWTGMHVTDVWAFMKNPSLDGILQIVPVLLVIISTVGIIHVLQKTLKSYRSE